MQFGIQNSVIAWDDPWHRESCKTMMRTGEGAWFPSQDPPPDKREFLSFITEHLGVDFYVHHVMPNDSEILDLISDLNEYGMDYILANEFGNANLCYTPGTNRYDVPHKLVEQAQKSKYFQGLLYDETEHLQLNNLIYQKDPHLFQWGNPNGLSVREMQEQTVRTVKELVESYNCPVYGEVLFCTMYHAFCRGGMRISAKAVKEIWQPIQMAVAMGAAKQYEIPLSVTVDLWGPDVGPWFTRLWGFPGHSPQEFANGLEMTYYLSPDRMFVENCDPLLLHRDKFSFTEFGEVYRDFIRNHKGKDLPYSASDCVAEIAVIRSDDGIFSDKGTFYGKGLYGADSPMPDEKSGSFFKVMHVLSHGTLPDCGSTPYLTGHDCFPNAKYPRDPETLRKFPLEKGVADEISHTLFRPLNNVLVFDSFADERCLRETRLIIVCGSWLSEETAEIIVKKAEQGAFVIAAEWFRPQLNGSRILFVSDFLGRDFYDAVSVYIGKDDEWRVKFPNRQLIITNPSKDGITLKFELQEENNADDSL